MIWLVYVHTVQYVQDLKLILNMERKLADGVKLPAWFVRAYYNSNKKV